MNIFDPLISGSLSVSGSGHISGDLTVLGTINATISGTTSNAISASHAAEYLLTSSFGSFTSSYTTGSFTGSFDGDGSNLINIPASGVTGLNLTQIADGSVTASVSNANGLRVNSNTEISGSLTITGSITLNGVPVGTGKLDEVVFNSYSSSNDTTNSLQNGRLDSLESSTSSLNTFTSSTNDKLTSLESTTSSLNTFTSSANGRLNSLETASGSIIIDLNTYTSSNNTIIGTIQTTTSSLNSFTSSANGRLNSLESASGSIRTDFNTYTSSNNTTNNTQDNRLNSIESTTSSLNSYTSSNNTRLGIIETSTGSLNTFTSSASTRLGSLETESGSVRTAFNSYTSSNDSTNSTQNGRLSALETSSGSLNSFTTSINSKIGLIETSTSSLNGFTSSINTTIKNRLDADNVISGSIQVNITGTSGFTAFSSSIATIDSSQDVRLNSIEGRTGSYATTGSNVFQGNQTITGSLFISQNLIVGGSSSINFISQSTLNIGTNLITVNAQNPGTRFGGLAVIDSGSSPQISGSILFDSINNQWLFVHQNQGTVTSSVILMGPETYNNLGNETYVTANRLVKSTGIEHLTDSNISDNGTTVTILSNAVVNGTFSATGTTLVSGSSQINHNATTNYVANQHVDHSTVSISTGVGSGLTGGGDITTTRNLSIATGGVTNAMLAGSIANDKLVNSSLTVGSTAISLGGSSATLAGLTSVTSTAFTGSLQGSISGNAATVTTNANLTGVVTSTGNATTIANGNITNAMLGGSIANDKLVNSSFHIGTTSISLGRASASQTLNGVSIDGNATSETLATVTGRGNTTTGNINVNGNILLTGTVTTTNQARTIDFTGFDKEGTTDFSDRAYIQHTTNTGGHAGSVLVISSENDSDDGIAFLTNSNSKLKHNSNNIATEAFVTSQGYITSAGTATNVSGTVAIANGGTGATDAATARTNLGLAIGTNVLAQRTFGTAANNNTGDFYPSNNPSGFITGTYVVANGTSAGDIDADWGQSFRTFDPIPSGTPPLQSPNIRTINVGENYARRTQLAFDFQSDRAFFRRRTDSGWFTWREFIHSGNIGSQTVSNVSGTVAVANGGTGATDAATARTNLGLAIGTNVLAQRTFGTAANNNTGDFYSSSNPSGYITSSGSISGNAATATEVARTVGPSTEANLLSATIADNDYFRLRVGGGSNAGFVEIATADDGTEPIHVRQYTGTFTSLARTATLLDGSGNTSFPGIVTAPTFSGNATSVTNGVYTTGDQSISGVKTFTGTLQGRKNQTANDYTTAAIWTESHGNTGTGIAFHISGNVGKYLEMRTNGILYWENNTVWTSGTLTNLNQLTNGPGYITSSSSISGNAGSVTNGVYTVGDQTIGGIKTFSTRINLHQSGAGGGQNIFSGLDGPTSANGRAQFILSSAYSDLVIASSQSNNQHGSTLSFAAYNPSNAAEYRKFVINQGNWGSRQHMLSFGYSNASQSNPHNDINNSVNVITLDGINKRLGIRVEDPLYNLHVNGTGYFSSNVLIVPTTASWGEGVAFTMPTTGTWGGLRWRRERGNNDGNWYVGFTALDSTDDLVFGANNGGAQVDNIIRAQKNGNVMFGTNTPGGRVTIRSTVANSTVLNIQGTSGQLFSVTDSLTGTIFAASDISGIPILEVNSNGTVTVDNTLNVFGDVTAFFSSDERLKDNVTPISNAIEKIKSIGGYEFDWNGLSKNVGHDVGVIAQEIEKILPEVVTTRDNGFKAVKYDRLTALLIQANKELIERVEYLESKIK